MNNIKRFFVKQQGSSPCNFDILNQSSLTKDNIFLNSSVKMDNTTIANQYQDESEEHFGSKSKLRNASTQPLLKIKSDTCLYLYSYMPIYMKNILKDYYLASNIFPNTYLMNFSLIQTFKLMKRTKTSCEIGLLKSQINPCINFRQKRFLIDQTLVKIHLTLIQSKQHATIKKLGIIKKNLRSNFQQIKNSFDQKLQKKYFLKILKQRINKKFEYNLILNEYIQVHISSILAQLYQVYTIMKGDSGFLKLQELVSQLNGAFSITAKRHYRQIKHLLDEAWLKEFRKMFKFIIQSFGHFQKKYDKQVQILNATRDNLTPYLRKIQFLYLLLKETQQNCVYTSTDILNIYEQSVNQLTKEAKVLDMSSQQRINFFMTNRIQMIVKAYEQTTKMIKISCISLEMYEQIKNILKNQMLKFKQLAVDKILRYENQYLCDEPMQLNRATSLQSAYRSQLFGQEEAQKQQQSEQDRLISICNKIDKILIQQERPKNTRV